MLLMLLALVLVEERLKDIPKLRGILRVKKTQLDLNYTHSSVRFPGLHRLRDTPKLNLPWPCHHLPLKDSLLLLLPAMCMPHTLTKRFEMHYSLIIPLDFMESYRNLDTHQPPMPVQQKDNHPLN